MLGSWFVVCMLFAGCEVASKDKALDAADALPDAARGSMEGGQAPEPRATLKGRVFDADTGRAIEGAELKSEAGPSATSDRKGGFELEVGAESKELKISRSSYASSSKEAPSAGGYVEVFLKDVDKTVEFNGKDGVSIKLESGASIEVPKGSVRDANGKDVKGLVNLELAEVDGHKRMHASALPGEMKARANGKDGRVAVHSALEIRMRDAKGNDLTVAPGKVTAELPIREADAPSKRDVFSYDERKGVWVAEGKAERVSKSDGKVVYRAKIEHLSWWSYADFFSELTCLRACVEDGVGVPVSGAQIWVVGASHPGVASMFSSSDGCAGGDIIAGARVVLVAQAEAGISEPTSHGTTSKIHLIKDGIGACDDAGTLVLGDAKATDCAHGFVECDGACAELATDGAHCGSCEKACDDTQQCLVGLCSGVDVPGMDAGPVPGADAGPVPEPVGEGGVVIPPEAGSAISDAGAPDAATPGVDAGPLVYGNPSAGLVRCGAATSCAVGSNCCVAPSSTACSVATCPISTQTCDGNEDCVDSVCCIGPDVDLGHRYGACRASCGGPNLPACHTDADCPFNSICGASETGAGMCSPKT